MFEPYAWTRVAWRLLLYLRYRLGWGKCPTLLDVYPEAVVVFDRVMGWPTRLFLKGTENCPKAGPAVFAGNHQKKDDPFITYRAIHRVCNWSYEVRYMMRDDFFKGLPNLRIVDINELVCLLGAQQISRDNVHLSQLKPFVQLLRDGNAYIMYPGRSRSRSGLFMEYREGIDEPGGVTFFMAQAQRGHPDLRVAAVPVARTYNPVADRTMIVFGEPLYLPQGADRAAQRDLDFLIVEKMGELLELNIPLVTAGILYLHCLHDRPLPLAQEDLARAVRGVLEDCAARRYVDEHGMADLPRELKRTLEYFEKREMLALKGTSVWPNREAILSAPEPDKLYVIKNPVKHLVNQLIHLRDVVASIESAAESLAKPHA